jgi:hypothetical protein
MSAQDTERAAPAGTGRDPQVNDRRLHAINIILSTAHTRTTTGAVDHVVMRGGGMLYSLDVALVLKWRTSHNSEGAAPTVFNGPPQPPTEPNGGHHGHKGAKSFSEATKA